MKAVPNAMRIAFIHDKISKQTTKETTNSEDGMTRKKVLSVIAMHCGDGILQVRTAC